ncbi:MAG: DNA alkylation repair protein [Terriglobales bacterium]
MKSPAHIAAHVRRLLRDGGSAPHSEEVQRFFKEEIKSRGWYTAELRKVAVRVRRAILNNAGFDFLLAVADRLFRGRVLEEKVFAVYLLEKSIEQFGVREFKLLESWLDRASSWADHDALVYFLISPMIAAEPKRFSQVFRWAKSPDRWHRRAACVGLIRAARRHIMMEDIVRLSNFLLRDEDDMVQKGLGWLLRETVKANPGPGLSYLISIRDRAPRRVLRTACETLAPDVRERVLGSRVARVAHSAS